MHLMHFVYVNNVKYCRGFFRDRGYYSKDFASEHRTLFCNSFHVYYLICFCLCMITCAIILFRLFRKHAKFLRARRNIFQTQHSESSFMSKYLHGNNRKKIFRFIVLWSLFNNQDSWFTFFALPHEFKDQKCTLNLFILILCHNYGDHLVI